MKLKAQNSSTNKTPTAHVFTENHKPIHFPRHFYVQVLFTMELTLPLAPRVQQVKDTVWQSQGTWKSLKWRKVKEFSCKLIIDHLNNTIITTET